MDADRSWGMSTPGIVTCSRAEAIAWEKILSSQMFLTEEELAISDYGQRNSTLDLPFALPSFQAAQKDWEAFRKSQCAFSAWRNRGRTIYSLKIVNCERRMTIKRAIDVWKIRQPTQ
jgi:uncharacterized protein YecT (DUF1311 family)